MNDWSARQYLKFEDDRTRPSRDLLAQVPLDHAARVFDLGCGPGNSTELLIERFPEADVIGLDSSSDMLRQARERLPGRTFVQGDLTTWNPPERTDLLFANAVFQWVPDHPAVLARLLNALPSSGVLAVQMPDNTNEPALALMRQVTARGPYARAPGTRACYARRPADAGRLLRFVAAARPPSRRLAHRLQSCNGGAGGDRRVVQGLGVAAIPRRAR